jgi:hypothetical protein
MIKRDWGKYRARSERIVGHSENAIEAAVSHSRLLPIIRKDGKLRLVAKWRACLPK